MNAIKKILAVSPYLLAAIPLGLPISAALAQTTVQGTAAGTGNTVPTSPITNATGIQGLLCDVVAWFIWIVIIVSVIMVVYAAFQYATAGDDTEKVATGRKTLTYAAVGIVVALCAVGFPTIVEGIFPQTVSYAMPSCLGGGGGSTANTGTGG